MFPILNIGPLAVQAPGLILLVSLWLGLTLAEREAKAQGETGDRLSGLVMTGLIAGLVGGRLWYAARYLDLYLADPAGLVALNTSAFDLSGGLAVGLLAAAIYGRRQQLRLRPTLDRLTPAAALIAIGLGLAHLAAGDAYGAPADLPWSIELWGAARHPSQLYEILAAALIFAVAWRFRRHTSFPGFQFLVFVALTAAAHLFLEAFRGDSTIVAGAIRQGQLAALLVLLFALWLLRQWLPHPASPSPPAPPDK